ncbi:MAG: ribosome small subunit-dependent GTPase A [Tissierellia bacterium]|nr:ribosome small subunit-dependent GTPase A [Tissierellia bacterium]
MIHQGKIVKLLGGFYTVQSGQHRYETRARGIFRHEQVKPLVGDEVLFSITEGDNLNAIEKILPRKNALIRPPVANVDQIFLFVPIAQPKYNRYTIDKLTVYYEQLNVPVVLLLTKVDLAPKEAAELALSYEASGFSVHPVSITAPDGWKELEEAMRGKVTALSGVSGAGKSTFTSKILGLDLDTQDVSRKTNRGKHTTRHTELYHQDGIFVFDTPGFSSFSPEEMESEEVKDYCPEFRKYAQDCRFQNCLHLREPHCGVKAALEEGLIEAQRYDSYLKLYEELKEREEVQWR